MKDLFRSVKTASRALLGMSAQQRTAYLSDFASLIIDHKKELLEANQKDLIEASDYSTAIQQRLTLNSAKLDSITDGIKTISSLTDPVGATIDSTLLDDTLVLHKVTVPIGVLGIIFESRPDVIPQILSLAIRSGNGVILKGGKEASNTNSAFMGIITKLNTLHPHFPKEWAVLLRERSAALAMLECPESIDLIIPRGSNALVAEIMSKSKVPVLGHADGVCHIYIDTDADLKKSIEIIIDAKTQYPAACNAVEMILIHKAIAEEALAALLPALGAAKVTVRYPVEPAEWHTEYGDLTVGIHLVDSIDAAIYHINMHGSHHTDVILSNSEIAQQQFLRNVDSACVFVNCSSRFADGQRFGLGAEVGIATGKLHARGPVGIEGLLTTQYRLLGDGHIVAPYTGDHAKTFLHRKI